MLFYYHAKELILLFLAKVAGIPSPRHLSLLAMKTCARASVQIGTFFAMLLPWLLASWATPCKAQDLAEIRERGVLRHLGVPYSRFVTGSGEGLDVEIVQLFAKRIGVRYEYVPVAWNNIVQDLIGQDIEYKPTPRAIGNRPIRGDIIASGLTILPNRKFFIDYSMPTFPSAIWLLARADSRITPIKPSGKISEDIKATKAKLTQGSTFVGYDSCLDPRLHGIEGKGYRLKRFSTSASLNDIVPAMLKKESDMTLLDVPDIIVSMEKWQGQIKVIGPISEEQRMAAGIRKTSPVLRQEFDDFLDTLKMDGTYMKLVRKYYPAAPRYLPEFFRDPSIKH